MSMKLSLKLGKEEADPLSDVHLQLLMRIAILSLPFQMIRLPSCLLLVSPTVSTLSVLLSATGPRESGRVLKID